jgi:hypothetical protein
MEFYQACLEVQKNIGDVSIHELNSIFMEEMDNKAEMLAEIPLIATFSHELAENVRFHVFCLSDIIRNIERITERTEVLRGTFHKMIYQVDVPPAAVLAFGIVVNRLSKAALIHINLYDEVLEYLKFFFPINTLP